MRKKAVTLNRTVATALLWLLCTLITPDRLRAEVYFDTDFESCNVGTGNDFPCDGWDDGGKEKVVGLNHNSIEITNTIAFSGTKSVKATWVNVNGGIDNPSITRYFNDSDHVFMRFATRQGPGFQIGSNNFTKMLRSAGSVGYPTLSLLLGSGKYVFAIEGGYDVGTAVTTTGVAPSSTSWDQVEVEWKLNTPGVSDGLIRVWVHGILRIELLNRELRGPTPTSVGAGGQVAPSTTKINSAQLFIQSGLGSMYFDRFAVGNTHIGLVGASGSSDTTAPDPVLNFRVQ